MNENTDLIPQETTLRTHDSCRQLLQKEVLSMLKELPCPWARMSNHGQRQWIERLDVLTDSLMKRLIHSLATDNRQAVRVTMEGSSVKDAIKVTMTAPNTPANIQDLCNTKGGWFFLVKYNEKHHMNRELPKADKDQGELILDPTDSKPAPVSSETARRIGREAKQNVQKGEKRVLTKKEVVAIQKEMVEAGKKKAEKEIAESVKARKATPKEMAKFKAATPANPKIKKVTKAEATIVLSGKKIPRPSEGPIAKTEAAYSPTKESGVK